MRTRQTITLDLTDEVRVEIETMTERTGRDFASVASELLTEAVKMRRIPGIDFTDGLTGRVARIAGTGLEVFEIVGSYRALDENWQRLRGSYDWLSAEQLQAALAHAAAYPWRSTIG